jgi:hypothetical protein
MAEQKKTTGTSPRTRTVAAKAASQAGSVAEKPANSAKTTRGSKRKQVAAVEAPLFDAAAMEAAIAVATPPEPSISSPKVEKPKAPALAAEAKAPDLKINGPIVVKPSAEAMSYSTDKTSAGPVPHPYAIAQTATAALRRVVAEATAATTSGALEVNDKVLDAWRAQSDAILDVWRKAITADNVPDAVRLHARGTQDAYAAAASQWKDVAETTTRWFEDALKPFRPARTRKAP